MRRNLWIGLVALLAAVGVARDAQAQAARQPSVNVAAGLPHVQRADAVPARPLPYAPGETLRFRASAPIVGRVGTGTMRVTGPVDVRGNEALLLSFEFAGRAGPFRLSDETHSWIDPRGRSIYRYHKRERSPMGGRHEEVEVFPAEQRWVPAGGESQPLATDSPLDELSFLYFLRTLPLDDGDVYELTRHFDPRRNPTRVRVLRRERLEVPAGEFAAVVVEMRVIDPERYGGHGTIVLHLSDDTRRLPLRIVSTIPGSGRITFSLESF